MRSEEFGTPPRRSAHPGEVVHELHLGNLMMLIRAPQGSSEEYTVQIGDYAPLDEFIARDSFTFSELPIVGRLLSAGYPWIFGHIRSS
jgi:hypothetical protein